MPADAVRPGRAGGGRARAKGGRPRPPRVVALGGGHGLAASLRALRHVTSELTAVVTVADSGGSSGRLREEFNCLPPGDLRMALAALSGHDEWGVTWREVLQHRLGGNGELAGHALGNLLIMGLWEMWPGDPATGLDFVGKLVGAEGRVLPMASVPLDVEADITRLVDGREWHTSVRGQANVAKAMGRVDAVRLRPDGAPACPEAVAAVAAADWVVLGPGSWYTSVIPHLLIPELAAAVLDDRVKRCVTLNLEGQAGETSGYSPADHLKALGAYAPGRRFDVVIVDESSAGDLTELDQWVSRQGGRLLVWPVRKSGRAAEHDSLRLAAAYREAFLGGDQVQWR
ncbi:MAG: uridine diphosphate-N-acetylglucosamine-binding protein YvcK [Bifidobacteriaceae bacterium]|nr:uridine diphosphate-N-acetylglucosamine-binding protein YvcK [Bifidobacteriaceae bacterium]